MDPIYDAPLTPTDPLPLVATRTPAEERATAHAPLAIVPRGDIAIRPGTLSDVPFIDRLQKAHARELGFLPTMALEGKIKLGQVLIAEAAGS